MVLMDRDTSVEHFDYTRINSEWAGLRLLAGLGTSPAAPRAAYLVVEPDPGGDLFYAHAGSGELERRLLTGKARGSELLWHATFALPLDVVEAPQALFKLITGDGVALALPAPWLRTLAPHQLSLSGYRSRQITPARTAFGSARRLAALATAVVVTASSTPAVALAVGDRGSRSAHVVIQPVAVSARRAAASALVAAAAANARAAAAQARSLQAKTSAALSTPTTSDTATTTDPQTTTGAPATTTSAAATTTTAAATTTPAAAATTTTAAAATTTTAAATTTSAAVLPTTPSMSSRRVITATPKTARASKHSEPNLKLVHLFSSPSHPAHQVANPARLATDCSTQDGAGAVTLAATTPGSVSTQSVSTMCTPASKTAAQGAAGSTSGPSPAAPPANGTSTPPANGTSTPARGATTPAATGKPTPEPASTHTAVPAAGPHPGARSHVTGGAALSVPTSGPDSTAPPGTPGSVMVLSSAPPGFEVPKAWTGTVTADPALSGAVTDLSGLLSNGNRPPSFLIPIYMQAGRRYHVPWEVLAAINAIESDYGQNLNTSSAGAVGWMQFEPSTWARYGMAVDGDSVPNPYDPRDAIFAAARYLAAAGAAEDISKAVFSYNHASWYVDEVLSRAQTIASHAQYEHATLKRGTFSVSFATGLKRQPTVSYQGGLLSPYDRLIAAANMVSAANFPYLYGGGHEQPAAFGPFDCSGSVSYVIQQAGYKVPTTVSGDIPIWKFPAGPGRVTIFYDPVHTYMRIGNRYFGTSGFARPGGGAGWFDVDRLPASYLSQFREVHVPGLGPNSFAAGGIPLVGTSTGKVPVSKPKVQSWSSFKANVQVWMSTLGPFPTAE